ncbi:MAG: IS66 family insertion sequence element accessory protein TnpB, partial [Enterococcus avium]
LRSWDKMFLDFTKVEKIFLVTGKTDLRKGIDGLARIIQQDYELDVYEDAIFLFCGNRCDRFKLLYWHNDGFFLGYKRIENGRLQWPRKKEEVRQLSVQQIHWLLEGLSIHQPKAIKAGTKGFF